MSTPGEFLQSFLGFTGKVALITGSTAGLGRSMAETLCKAGCKVVINGRSEDRTATAAADIAQACQVLPESVLAAHGDTSQPEACAAIVDRITAHFGRLDILVNNAGINLPEGVFEEQYSPEQWNKISQVNISGPMNMTAASLPLLKKSPAGRIINLSSMIAHVGSPSNTLYTMTKAAMLLFTKSLAADLAGKDDNQIVVNSISPGVFRTEMNAKFTASDEALKEIESTIPMRRLGNPDELAGIVMFLASDAASYTTGSDVVVDGGFVAV